MESAGPRHAVAWFLGQRRDLGTLGGPSSTVVWPGSVAGDMVVGFSETAELDENEEAWSCSAFFPPDPPGEPSFHVCRGFAYFGGQMRPMPTLGGTDSAAVGTNDRGQVVGISGECDQAVGRASARYAVMWEDGVPKDLGDIGGDHWNTPAAINEKGQVVGFANVTPGPGFNTQGFLWTDEDGMQKLGPLGDDTQSQAWGINKRGQVVGLSRRPDPDLGSFHTAVLWQDGEIIDLNDRVASGYEKHLAFANDINDLGVITGQAVDLDTNEAVAFWAIPIPGHGHAGSD